MKLKQDLIKDQIKIAKAIDEDIIEYQSLNVVCAYQKTHERIETFSKHQFFKRYFYRIASVLLIPLLLSTGTFSYLYFQQLFSEKEIAFHKVSSAPGLITQLELPDKSKVWLNSGSTLRYPSSFEKDERTVYLEGEGYFEVESDEKNPFYVNIGEYCKVRAYGTKFNVNSYGDDLFSEVVLESGKISFLINNKEVQLEPGEIATYDEESKKVLVKKILTDEKTAWRNGKLIFRNTSLKEVIRSLSRRYNVDIVLHEESTTAYKFRASFSNETISQILNYLKLAAPIEWSFNKVEQNDDSSFVRERIDLWLKDK